MCSNVIRSFIILSLLLLCSESTSASRWREVLATKTFSSSMRAGSRIAGGTEAARNQFNFAALFFIYALNGEQSLCSGSIISTNFVLSAAHCFNTFSSADLLAGIHNFQTDDPLYEIELTLPDITIHESYDKVRFTNDIAVVSTRRRPFTFNRVEIQPINIAPRSFVNANLTGLIGRVAGWGLTSDNPLSSVSPVPRFIDAAIITNNQCALTYGTIITSGNFCLTGANGRSTCPGDSGGGVTIAHGTSRVLIGLVSFGSDKGCTLGYPTSQTRVTSFLDWITRQTGLIFT